jgi:hypothetical protein
MRIRLAAQARSAGYALLMVMSAAAALLLVMASTMLRTATNALLNTRNQQYTSGLYAAEAADEKVLARMRSDFANGGLAFITNNLSIYRTLVPTNGEDPYWSNYQFSDGLGNVNYTYVQCISNNFYTLLSGPYAGLQGWSSVYRILSNVTETNSNYRITNALQQDIECDIVPVFQFAIFYNSLLEFTWAAPLSVRGPTHANSCIFVGSSSPLTFYAMVTSSGIICETNWGGHTLSQYTGSITFATNLYGGYSTNYPVLTLPIGTNNTPDAVRQVVYMPPPGEDPTSQLGQQRYYNLASMDLLVSNNTVTAIVKNSATDPSPATLVVTNYGTNNLSLASTFPFLSVTNTFTDQRENSETVLATQIDMGKLATWAGTNSAVATKRPSSNPFNILYVADNRTPGNNELPSVRLCNGTVLPAGTSTNGAPTGFTLATPNPLYVWGNYNCTNSSYLNTTNTSATVPASLISDALTILSPSWQDAQSNARFQTGVRPASDTTINAAILTGVVYTSGSSGSSPFSGGVVNMPRLLEDWGNGGSTTLTLNTSMVNLYNSVIATNPFQNPGVYYYAPTRSFNFDLNFTNQSRLPPGTPMLNYLYRHSWAVPPPATTNFYVGS